MDSYNPTIRTFCMLQWVALLTAFHYTKSQYTYIYCLLPNKFLWICSNNNCYLRKAHFYITKAVLEEYYKAASTLTN